jgi:chorismate synthase
LVLSEEDIQRELDRRKPGQSSITSPRKEQDIIRILSGVFEGRTTGTPLLLLANNDDARPEHYAHLKDVYRPSHADYTYEAKYGLRDYRGSGRASARETLARVAAGAVAQKYLLETLGVTVVSYVERVGNVGMSEELDVVTKSEVDASIVRCPDQGVAEKMIKAIEDARDEGDSLGGVIRCVVTGVPAGLGEPVFDRLSADLAKAMLSINATKGFEIGSGFAGTAMLGSEHNDSFYTDESGRVRTRTNYSGGVQGGISNGEAIHFRVAFKPVATIRKAQETLTREKKSTTLEAAGRHDPCVLPRAVPIVDAMAALVIMDHLLRWRAIK